MLSSKEALEKVIEDISLEWGYEGIEDELREKLKPLYEDLNRLEELEKVINNIFYVINQGLGMLPNNNFEFLKEVLENDK